MPRLKAKNARQFMEELQIKDAAAGAALAFVIHCANKPGRAICARLQSW